ncbi:hypothetical protein GVAV_001918 [Gurleya vavrai]
MATAAKKKTQVSLVSQVNEELLKDFREMNRDIKRNEYSGKDEMIYWIKNGNKIMIEFLVKNDLHNVSIDIVCLKIESALDKKRKVIEQEEVFKLRRRLMQEKKEEDEAFYRKWFEERKLWRPRNAKCWICFQYGHQTQNCRYTYEKMAIKLQENKKEIIQRNKNSEIVESKSKKTGNFKRLKVGYLSKEEFFVVYKDVFYKENEHIKFCKLEKCKIDTKRGCKIVKKGQMIPQALKGATENYINDLTKEAF